MANPNFISRVEISSADPSISSNTGIGAMATWGPKSFIVSPQKIAAMEGLTFSVSVKSDNGYSAGGTSTTNTRGREATPVSFSVKYVRGMGVDPYAEQRSWESLVGERHYFNVGGRLFSKYKMLLKHVDFNVTLSDSGVYMAVDVKISLVEDPDISPTEPEEVDPLEIVASEEYKRAAGGGGGSKLESVDGSLIF